MALILAADDEPAARDIVKRILQRAGHEVVAVADGESALREIHQHRPDLVLTDVDMPLMNGFLLCDEVRHDPLLRHIPVILVTGVVNPEDNRATEVGVTAVLVKPFTSGDLLSNVERHLPDEAAGSRGAPAGEADEAVGSR